MSGRNELRSALTVPTALFVCWLLYHYVFRQAVPDEWLRPSCRKYYGARRYATPEEVEALAASFDLAKERYCPALLWAYPGSGNTKARLQLEMASGLYSGSAYTDFSLADILPGETTCNASVAVVEAHPQWHPIESLGPSGMRPLEPGVPPEAKELCACPFTRAVVLIRDPLVTFLSEYKRRKGHDALSCSPDADGELRRRCRGGHNAQLALASFDDRDFRREATRMAREWIEAFDSYERFSAKHGRGNLLVVQYEHLEGTERASTLSRLLTFLHLQHPAGGKHEERFACAAEAAEHPAIHRKPDSSSMVNMQHAYADTSLVCSLWELVGPKAQRYGYKLPEGVVCEGASQ